MKMLQSNAVAAHRRDPAIELYRCLLMFGIVLLHVISQYGQEWHWLSSSFAFCVPGFVFITGYYGCKFSLRKVLTLYAISLWSFCVSVAFLLLVNHKFSPAFWMRSTWDAFLSAWFIHAYVILLMVAPIINSALEQVKCSKDAKEAIRIFGPYLLLIFGWSYIASFNFTNHIIPKPSGLESHFTGWTLIGVYIAARLFHLFGYKDKISTPWAVAAFVCAYIVSMSKCGLYNSVIALVAAGAGFVILSRIRIPDALSNAILFIAPSMFSIYVLHLACLPILPRLVDCVQSATCPPPISLYIVFPVSAVIVFAVCLLVDVLRRVLIKFVRFVCAWR